MTGLFFAYVAVAFVVILITVVIPIVKDLILPDPVQGASIQLLSCKRRVANLTRLLSLLPPEGSSDSELRAWASRVVKYVPPTALLEEGKAMMLSKAVRRTRELDLASRYPDLASRNFISVINDEELSLRTCRPFSPTVARNSLRFLPK